MSLSLYNGVSDRSRGWKRRRSDAIVQGIEMHSSSNPHIMRWDGASRSSSLWDGLRRDPELWCHDGSCYVHLYAQGQSLRGPSFKIPLAALLETDCYPLMERFMPRISESPADSPAPYENALLSTGATKVQPRIDLFIPAPAGSDKQQSFNHHVATRNFFAFVCRRSIVGEHLGTALVSLMDRMYEFRTPGVDNLTDILSYMDEEGYLDFKITPSHALAVLYFAEALQLRDWYIDAFVHCCGMSDQLSLGSDYELISPETRKLLRRARIERDLRLGQMGSMLRTFLEDELSEAHLGLYPGARAHLERFRTLLQGFYATKFGYYPPSSTDPRTEVFDIDVFRTMRNDFEALFNYLVDETFDPSQGSPPLAQGGICTLQSVQSFDIRYNFATLDHPFPLLPEVSYPTNSRRLSWFSKVGRAGVGDRVSIHAALLRATNQKKPEILDNELVRTYRRFEEDSVYSPLKADKLEGLGPIDARKVRWILIYSIYQTLRQATQPPPEVKDAVDVPYHLCIATHNLPPWEELPNRSLARRQTEPIIRNPSAPSTSWNGSTQHLTPPSSPSYVEIKPDIDYFALKQKDNEAVSRPPLTTRSARRVSLTQSLSRDGSVRRSLRIFSRQQPDKPVEQRSRPSSSQYKEILVQRYGNGINAVDLGPLASQQADDKAGLQEPKSNGMTARSLSTASNTSSSSKNSNSESSIASTGNTSPIPSAPYSPATTNATTDLSWGSRRSSLCVRGRTSDMGSDGPSPRAVSMYTRAKSVRFACEVLDDGSAIASSPLQTPPRTACNGYRKSMEPPPLNIRKAQNFTSGAGNDDTGDELLQGSPSLKSPADWEDIKSLLETRARTFSCPEDDIKPHWDDYNDLGGLTELKG